MLLHADAHTQQINGAVNHLHKLLLSNTEEQNNQLGSEKYCKISITTSTY